MEESNKRLIAPAVPHGRRACSGGCQVLGCTAGITKLYCQRKHLCESHMQAESVQLPGSNQLYRYCFQCGKLEELACFDGLRRTCRQRLEKRRNNPSCKKRSSSGCTSASTSSSSPRSAAPIAALGHVELPDLQDLTAPCSPAADSEQPQAHAVAFNTLAAAADSLALSSYQLGSMGSGISSAGSWAAADFPAAISPDPSLHQHLQDLYDACGPAHAAAPAAAAGNPFMLPVHDWTAAAQDVESLELMLESELTAAALHAHLTAYGSSPLDAESQRVSQQLAAAVVEHSGLFETTPAPSKPQAPMRPDPVLCSQQLCSVTVSSSSAAAAGPCHASAMMCSDPTTASCHPAAYWGPEGCGINLAAVQGPASHRAPAYTAAASAASCAGPQVSMPFRSGFPSVVPPAAPSRQEPAAAGVLTAQVERLEQLKQQMFNLQARVDLLKRHLCM